MKKFLLRGNKVKEENKRIANSDRNFATVRKRSFSKEW